MANKCYDIIKILSSNKLTYDKNNYISCTVTLLIKANFIITYEYIGYTSGNQE